VFTPAGPRDGDPFLHGARFAWLLAALAGTVALLVAFVGTRAWLAGTNDPDSMSSVLYFQRLISGQRLEVTVLTTPKPLHTLVYGVSWVLFHDWRTIVWETIAMHAAGVALATRLAIRLAGVPAGVFIATALILSSSELAEVSQANSLPWALTGWLVAALALTSNPRRFGIAGLALFLAGTTRIETWLILAAATAAIVALGSPWVRSRAPASWPTARSSLPLLIGWLAVPVQLLHDLLLTGNPLYWAGVPSAYTLLVTPHLAPVPPLHFAQTLAERYGAMPWLVLLAALGVIYLARQRRWVILVGLGGLVAGSLVLIGSLAVRAVFISDRYYEEPTLGIVFAAAIGFGGVVVGLIAIARRYGAGPVLLTAIWTVASVAAAGGAAAATGERGPVTTTLAARIMSLQGASSNLESAVPQLRRLVAAGGATPPALPVGKGVTVVDPTMATLYVPRSFQRRVAIELGVPLTRFADSSILWTVRPASILRPGQLVYHDPLADGRTGPYRLLEVSRPTAVGSLRLVPIAHPPGRYWLILVER